MMEELNCWNQKLVYDIFDRDEAIKICSIPLSRREVEDKAIWGYTKNEKFSVRSAYHLGMSKGKEEQRESSLSHEQKVVG